MYTAPRSPQSIGAVVDSSIGLFKETFRYCWPAALLYGVLSIALGLWMQMKLLAIFPAGVSPNPATASAAAAAMKAMYTSPSTWGTYLVLIAIGLLFNLMVTLTIIEVSNGRPGSSALAHFKLALKLLPGALVVTVVIAIAIFVGMLLLVVPGIFLIGRWSLWAAAYSDQRGQAFAALGRSWELVGGNWWRTVVVLSVVGVVIVVLLFVLSMISGLIAAAMSQTAATRIFISQVLQGFAQVVYVPAFAASLVAVYQDLKLRKGGADLEARLGDIDAPRS